MPIKSLELAVNTSDFSLTPSLLCLLQHILELLFLCGSFNHLLFLSRGFVTYWSEVLVLYSLISPVNSLFSDSGCLQCFLI